jgi:glycosyltransferase involved in cell wall biosynthesis
VSQTDTPPLLALVVPCFNEATALPFTLPRLLGELASLVEQGRVAAESTVYLVDDGSTDRTWSLITEQAAEDPRVAGIRLSRNYGHQYALYAGLMEARGDALVSLDADLQDDVGVIADMLDAFREGSDVVYGVREDRSSDSAFKRWTALAHYWLSERMGITTVRNHADYRLMSRRAVEFLRHYREANLYLRGIVPQLGLPSSRVYYRRDERVAGTSKYSFLRMLSLSVRGVTSFSIAPLRFIAAMGVVVFTVSVTLGLWALWGALFSDKAVPGWASTVIPIYLLGGLQLLAIGVAGEYIGKTYLEVKGRPLYLVEQRVGQRSESD